jgi:hypothetical protein
VLGCPRIWRADAPPHKSGTRRSRRPCVGYRCPAQYARGCGEACVKKKGGGGPAARGALGYSVRKAYKRTTAQLVQDDAPPVLYVPCAIARRYGGAMRGVRGRLGARAYGVRTHHRTSQARGRGVAARAWVKRALRITRGGVGKPG